MQLSFWWIGLKIDDAGIGNIKGQLADSSAFVEKLATAIFRDLQSGKIKEEDVAKTIEENCRARFISIAAQALTELQEEIRTVDQAETGLQTTIQHAIQRVAILQEEAERVAHEEAALSAQSVAGRDTNAQTAVGVATLATFIVAAAHMYTLGNLHFGPISENLIVGILVACSWPGFTTLLFWQADKLNETFNETPKRRAVWKLFITITGFVAATTALHLFAASHPWFGPADRHAGGLLAECLLAAEAIGSALAFSEYREQRKKNRMADTLSSGACPSSKSPAEERKRMAMHIEEHRSVAMEKQGVLDEMKQRRTCARAGIQQLEAVYKVFLDDALVHGKAHIERLRFMFPNEKKEK